MDLSDAQKEEISRLRQMVQCSKGHRCTESGHEDLCEVLPIGRGESSLLQCLGKEPCAGECSEIFGYSMRVCNCPLRKFIWEEFGKREL